MLGSQFYCLATQETLFQIAIDKSVLYQKTNCYKGKKLLIEDDEDAPPTKYVKARLCPFFKHEHEALKQKTELTNLDWYVMKRFYILKEHYSSLERIEKPHADAIHHENG